MTLQSSWTSRLWSDYRKILWGKNSSLASVNVLKVSEIPSFPKSLLASFPFQMVLEQVYYFYVFKNLVIGNEWTWFIYSLVPSLCVPPSVSPWRGCGLEMRLVHLLQMKHIWEFLATSPQRGWLMCKTKHFCYYQHSIFSTRGRFCPFHKMIMLQALSLSFFNMCSWYRCNIYLGRQRWDGSLVPRLLLHCASGNSASML